MVVSHADPIKSAIAHYTGMHLDLFQRLHVSPASVTVFDFHTYGVMLVKCNDTGGLDDLLPEPRHQTPDRRAAAGADRERRRSSSSIRSTTIGAGAFGQPGRAHVRDPGPQGRRGALGARREGTGRACSRPRPSQFLDRIAEEDPEEPDVSASSRRSAGARKTNRCSGPGSSGSATTPSASWC